MLPAVPSRVVAVQPALDALGRERGESRAAFAQFQLGQLVVGKVLGHHRDLTLVRIENQTVAMRLPRPAEQGETLKLSFAGHMPQAVFLLEAAEARTSSLPQLSQTARMLSEMMQRVPARGLPTLQAAAPLLDSPAATTAEMAGALRGAVVRSGLFYESHLARWVEGRDSLDGLMREPQNRLSAESRPPPVADDDHRQSHPLHTLLTQQLQVLESPQFAWRGELWPGQTLEWQMQRDDAPDPDTPRAPGEVDSGSWHSRLRVSLPQLGEIEFQIHLDARQGFHIRVTAAEVGTQSRLRDARADLREHLVAAGLALATLEMAADEA